MTSQEKKAWLQRYVTLNRKIDQKLDELARLRTLCEKTTALITGLPKGQRQSTRENVYVRLADLSREIDADIDRYVDMRREIEAAIDTVPDPILQTLLRYRYINGATWEKIAVEMGYSWKQTFRLHGAALEKMTLNDTHTE